MGVYEHRGSYGHPLSLTNPMPASKVGTSYLKLNVLPYYLLTWSLTNTRGAAYGSGT